MKHPNFRSGYLSIETENINIKIKILSSVLFTKERFWSFQDMVQKTLVCLFSILIYGDNEMGNKCVLLPEIVSNT